MSHLMKCGPGDYPAPPVSAHTSLLSRSEGVIVHWRSKLIHPARHAPAEFKSLATPVHRGSTVVFDRQRDLFDHWRQTER